MKKILLCVIPLNLLTFSSVTLSQLSEKNLSTFEINDEEKAEDDEDVILVTSSVSKIAPPQVIDSTQISQGTISDGNVTDLLRTSPAVQFSNKGNSGLTQGEIKPSDISIHGSVSYQNNYRLDGVSFNNDIDPADPGLGITNTRIDSDEQGVYIDSRLISELRLYDNNIPAEYGGFTGGVVDVIGRRWSHQNSAHVFYRVTDSSWNKTHVDPAIKFDSANNDASHPSRFQPKYSKQNFGGWFETGITDDLGFVFSASRRESDISSVSHLGPSVILDNGQLTETASGGGMKNQTRVSDNISSKFTWYLTDKTSTNLSVNYSHYNNYSFAATVANSGYDTEHNGINTALQLLHEFDFAKLDMTASYQVLEDDRKNDQDYFVSLSDYTVWSNPVEYRSGGVGDLKTKQNNLALKTKLAFNPFNLAYLQHEPSIGFEIAQTKAQYIRDKDFFRYTYRGTWSSIPWISFADHATVFEAGRYKAQYDSYSVFADNTMEYGRLTIRPGIRLDYDSFIEDVNIAPRLATSFDMFGDGSTTLNAGVNRYYGRTMMVYALYGAQNAGLKNCYSMCTPGVVDDDWISLTDFEGLDKLSTPYNDEVSVGAEQVIINSIWQLQYVHRESYDEVRSSPKPNTSYPVIRTFDNSGRSHHDTVSLSVRNRLPIYLKATEHTVLASISWQQSKSNTPKELGYAHYDSTTNIRDDKVWYDGKIISASDLPSTDFNIPFRINLELTSKIPQYDLTFYNLFQWHSSRNQAVRYSNQYYVDPNNGDRMVKYNKERFASTFRWDVKANWNPAFTKGANLSVEVNNVLNKKNITDRYVYGSNASGNDRIINAYEPGRQFWVQVGYDF